MPAILKPGFKQARVNWAHSLARGLVGAWPFNECGGNSINSAANRNDALTIVGNNVTNQGFWFISGAAGATFTTGYRFRNASGGGNSNAVLATPSSALKPAHAVSLYWKGTIHGNGNGSNNPALAYMSYTSSNTSPFVAYGLARKSATLSSIVFLDDAGGTSHSQEITNVVPSYPTSFDATLTFKDGGNATCYINGSNKASSARSGALSYVSSEMFVSRDFTSGEFGDESVDVIYIWNRELSSSEVAFLHAQPYCIFEKPDRLLYVPPPPLQPAVVSPDMQLPQLLAQ